MFETFISACLSGKAGIDEIEDYINRWYSIEQTEYSLEEFLGMTSFEYGEWLKTGEDIVLRDILAARELKVPYDKYKLMSEEKRIAARSFDIKVVEELKNKKETDD